MPSGLWTDAFLDRMRQVADPLADEAIKAVFARGDTAAVQAVLDSLTRNVQIVPESLPPEVVQYFTALPEIPTPEERLIVEGQRLFADYGPEIMMILACYSLPAAYAARKGVQVLYRTGYLAQRANRRLFQTAQMVVDVMTPGGLGPTGRGRVTAQKVRLMHAAIRHLLQSNPASPWPVEFDVPINQEDLAGTLMTFTHLIRDGLDRLGIKDSWPPGYLNAWQAVARMMGIVEELIPATLDESTELTAIIQGRQVEPCPEGQALTKALLDMMQEYCLPGFKGLPGAFMRLFLPPLVADGLGVPNNSVYEEIVRAGVRLGDLADRLMGSEAGRTHLRTFSLHIVQMFITAELGGRRPDFQIPTELQDTWQLSKT